LCEFVFGVVAVVVVLVDTKLALDVVTAALPVVVVQGLV
jgi:hypothetical protein